MLLALMQQPSTSGNFVQDTLGSMITAYPYKCAAAATAVVIGCGWNWWHHKRYVLDPQELPAPDKDAKHITLFVHGAFDASKQALQMLRKDADVAPYLVEKNLITFNFDDSFALSRIPFWCFKGCLAQDADVAALHAQIEEIKQNYPQLEGITLVGISRGASAIINYTGTHGTDKIAACVLESPFDSMEKLLELRTQKRGVSPSLFQWIKPALLAVIAGRYRTDGIQPIDMINKINADIPTLIVAVESDHAVPYAGTCAVYEALRHRGATRTHMLTLKAGRHGALIKGSDGQQYQDVAHAFFKTYGLPHNTAFAERGTAAFEQTLNA